MNVARLVDRPVRTDPGALRVAVVSALAASSMLFASLVSAYLVRRSFADWRPVVAMWPLVLLAMALVASAGLEVAIRSEIASRRRLGLAILGLGSALYLLGALAAIVSLGSGERGLSSPHRAFVVLLLGVHVVHALLGAAFAGWALRSAGGDSREEALELIRLVIHFLTVLLIAVVGLLFIVQ